MSYDAQKVTYQEVTIFDRPALFTECRIDRATMPEGVYRYELRHGDEDWGEPRELARNLMVNFYGTVLTREPFQLPIDGWIPLESDSLSFQDSGCRTLAEFQEKYPASDKDVIDFYSVNEPALHALYFSRSEEQDKTVGCVGHLRGDFGSGKQFYTTWWPHQQDALNTPEFKADIDRTVNWLREQPDSPLRDFDSMKRYCNRYEQICAIKGALLPSCGFMVKTKQYVYTRTKRRRNRQQPLRWSMTPHSRIPQSCPPFWICTLLKRTCWMTAGASTSGRRSLNTFRRTRALRNGRSS